VCDTNENFISECWEALEVWVDANQGVLISAKCIKRKMAAIKGGDRDARTHYSYRMLREPAKILDYILPY